MTQALEQKIATQLAEVRERITRAATRAGRDPREITLVAVTKTWPAEVVIAAHRAGARDVGENRAEELSAKRAEIAASYPAGSDLVWHQIGTLQSRKTRLVAENADMFHALDRLKVARRLSEQLVEVGRSLPVLLEVNLSGESSKSGYSVNVWESDATQRDNLRKVIDDIARLPGLELQGLMTMAPWDVEESLIRSVFRRTKLLRDWLREERPELALPHLSMGMTDDFEIAIEEGATLVRIGRAIFGSRA
jgi:pyridoxal phosphate enzyme (YggS family)